MTSAGSNGTLLTDVEFTVDTKTKKIVNATGVNRLVGELASRTLTAPTRETPRATSSGTSHS